MAIACLQKASRYVFSGRNNVVILTTVRGKIYDGHVDPILDKEVLAQPIKSDDPRRNRKTKAATSDQSTLLGYDPLLHKFTNMVMMSGKKRVAKEIMAKAFENIKINQLVKYHKANETDRASIELNPLTVLYNAVENCKPSLTVRRIIRGGVAYRVPFPITEKEQQFRSMKWLVLVCRDRDRTGKMNIKLAEELLDAANNKGRAIRRKQDLHRLCETNKAFAGYRWGK